MNRTIIVLACLTIMISCAVCVCAQNQTLVAALDRLDVSNGGGTPNSHIKDELFIELMISPDTVPHLNIPVLDNAIGDVVQDNLVNILDLLRLRDIIIGRPPSQTSYEAAEGDLTRDGILNSGDLNYLRDVLLRKISVPYVIDSLGGRVSGDGITLSIPPGAVDSPIAISIERFSESEFARDMGVDTRSAVEDSAYFMASFKIISDRIDFNLPVGAEIKLDTMPPCAYEGLNGLFAAVPDRDGDGKNELFLINELEVNGDSLTLTAKDIPVPNIGSISASTLEPGQSLVINGSGFGDDPQSIVVRFVSAADIDSFQNLNPWYMDDSTILAVAPGYPAGPCDLVLYDLRSGVTSNSVPLEILLPPSVSGDIRAIIVNFYIELAVSLDSTDIYSLYSSIEDTTIRQYFISLTQDVRRSVDTSIGFFTAYPDSLIDELAPVASFIQTFGKNADVNGRLSILRSMKKNGCPVCEQLTKELNVLDKQLQSEIMGYNYWAALCAVRRTLMCSPCEQAERFRRTALNVTDVIAAIRNLIYDCYCRNCPQLAGECDKCKRTVFIGYGPQGKKISGGFSESGWSTNGCCINIKKYQSNQCISVPQYMNGTLGSPVPQATPDELKCPPPSAVALHTVSAALMSTRPNPGSIIKITNSSVPYNIIGILNENGNAFIPHVPMNTKVTFSMYDPVTGLYDPDAGTYTTGSTPGGFDRPILLFKPNTEVRNFTLKIGEPAHDSVSLDLQRIDYLLKIGAADTSRLFNIGFGATARRSLRIEDPEGIILFDNSDISCYSNAHIRFNKTGVYIIRVAFGASGQSGSFDLGVSYSPDKPLPSGCLCGYIATDTLYEELSPYDVLCEAAVAGNDTLTSEAGVIIEFDEGGVITADGVLKGSGTPVRPILLKHYMKSDKDKILSNGDRIKNGTQARREVER